MENGKTPDFEKTTTKAINALHYLQKEHLNRQLAIEALLTAMLARVQPEALQGLLEEYDAACDRLASQLPVRFQQPRHWQRWSDAITDRQKSLQQAIQPNTPGAR